METLNLQSRQKNLLSVLNKKHGAASGKELAAALDVSERTIRSDIRELNEKLNAFGVEIRPVYGKGYSLQIKDRRVFVELFSEKESYASKDDRVRTLLIRLLRENDWCELGMLEDEMFVSRTTLENDLKTVKKTISAQHPYLQMERKGNFVRLENNEIKRRDILIRSYAEYWDYDSREGIVLKRDDVSEDLLRSVQTVVKETFVKWKVFLDDSSYIYMVLAIAIMFYRVKDGHVIRHTEVKRPDSDIADPVRYIVETLNVEWQMEFRRAELIWLSDILRQLSLLCSRSYSKNRVLENTDVLCHHIVNDLLEQILEQYGIDFTADDRLFVDLTRHVQALFDGIVAPQTQNLVLGDELRIRYPFVGDIAGFARKFLEKQCEIALGREEEDYLFPFLVSAYQNLFRKSSGNRITASVISHLNGSITHYMTEQFRNSFGDVLELRGPYPIYAKEQGFAGNPDLVISTVQTSRFQTLCDAPILTVSPILKSGDLWVIQRTIERVMCRKIFGDLPHEMHWYFRKDLTFQMANKESLTTTLASIREVMQEKRYVGKIRQADPEKDCSVLLKNGFLFVYQVEESVSEAVASLVTLKRSISWKHLRSVQTIMYMVLPPSEKPHLGWFYHMAQYLSEKSDVLEGIQKED